MDYEKIKSTKILKDWKKSIAKIQKKQTFIWQNTPSKRHLSEMFYILLLSYLRKIQTKQEQIRQFLFWLSIPEHIKV